MRGNTVAGNVTDIYSGLAAQASQDVESKGQRSKLEGEVFFKKDKRKNKNSQAINLPAGALYCVRWSCLWQLIISSGESDSALQVLRPDKKHAVVLSFKNQLCATQSPMFISTFVYHMSLSTCLQLIYIGTKNYGILFFAVRQPNH